MLSPPTVPLTFAFCPANLSSCASVSKNAQQIYNQVCTDPNNPDCQAAMPPDGNWSDEWQQNFKAWMDAGAKCP